MKKRTTMAAAVMTAVSLMISGCGAGTGSSAAETPVSSAEESVQESEESSGFESLSGGWTFYDTEPRTMSDGIIEMTVEAASGMPESVTPMAHLGFSGNAGEKNAVLVKVTPDSIETESRYGVMFLTQNDGGSVTLDSLVYLDPAAEEGTYGIDTGAAAGSWQLDTDLSVGTGGDANGNAAYAGDASGNAAYAGDASGNAAYAGDASGNAAYVGDASGNAAYAGDASGNAAYAGDASGNAAYIGGTVYTGLDYRRVLSAASAGVSRVEYEPVACLATQVVSGLNYSLLCRVTTLTAEPYTHLALVRIYQDLSGHCEITDSAAVVLEAMAS